VLTHLLRPLTLLHATGKSTANDPYAVPKKGYKSKYEKRSKDMLNMDSKELLKYTQSQAAKKDDPYEYDADAYDKFRRSNFIVAQKVKSNFRDGEAAGLKLQVGLVIKLQARFRSVLTRMRYRKHLLQLQQDREVRELERKAQQHRLAVLKQREMVQYTPEWYKAFRTSLIRADPRRDEVVSSLKQKAVEKALKRDERRASNLSKHPKLSDMDYGGDTVLTQVNTVQQGKYYEFKQPPPSVSLTEYPPSQLDTKKRPTVSSPILQKNPADKVEQLQQQSNRPDSIVMPREGSSSVEPQELTPQQVVDRGVDLDSKLSGAMKKVMAAEEELAKPGWPQDKVAELEKRLKHTRIMHKSAERAVKNWQSQVVTAKATLEGNASSIQMPAAPE
jgi:hypothetical protein